MYQFESVNTQCTPCCDLKSSVKGSIMEEGKLVGSGRVEKSRPVVSSKVNSAAAALE